jgi:hypothetical protein
MNSSSKRTTPRFLPETPETYLAFVGVLLAGIFYATQTGVLAVWPDSLYFADRARHLLEQGQFLQSANYPATTQPLYSLLMVLAFGFPDIAAGHQLLLFVQSILLASGFFPLRMLLLRHTGLKEGETSLLAAAGILLPSLFSYAPFLTQEALLIMLLIYAAYFIDRLLDAPLKLKNGVGAGVFLSLAVLTHPSAVCMWLAALAMLFPLMRKATKGQKRIFTAAFLLPVLAVLLWAFYVSATTGTNPLAINLEINNGLARFNFVKNAALYYIYAGAPLAGLTLILAGFMKGKSVWQQKFVAFSLITLVLLAFYTAFTNGVIVEKKLDYITNRTLDPWLFLPLVALFRLDDATRKDLLTNGLLLFFVFMIFGLPYGLNIDFRTGMAFWTGPLPGNATPMVRDVLYMIVIALPVALLYMWPRWFVAGYTFMLFFMVSVGLPATHSFWSLGEDARLTQIGALALHDNPALKQADTIYVDYHCRGAENNDIAYLFGCFDLGKALYFLPKLPQKLTAEELINLPPAKLKNAVFATTEKDNRFGPVVAQSELAHFMAVTPESVKEAARAPLVQISRIEGLRPYASLALQSGRERFTMLERETTLTLQSERAGCIVLEAKLYADEELPNLTTQLNEAAPRKLKVPLIRKGVQSSPVEIKLNIPEGKSQLVIRYKDGKPAIMEGPNLILFGRPVVRSCGRGE